MHAKVATQSKRTLRLNKASIEKAAGPAPGKKDAFYFDDKITGFGLRVTAAGGRSLFFQYSRAGVKRRMLLGRFGERPDASFRKEAEELRARTYRGDPALEDKVARAATVAQAAQLAATEKAEADAVAAEAAQAQYTVGKVVDEWASTGLKRAKEKHRTRAPQEVRRLLQAHLNKPATALTMEEAIASVEKVAKTVSPDSARRVRTLAQAAFAQAVGDKKNPLAVNVWLNWPKKDQLMAKDTQAPRERVLSSTELGVLFNAAGNCPQVQGSLIRMLILSGQRRAEVAEMKWTEVDFAERVWRIPANRTKNGFAHNVPLTDAMITELHAMDATRRSGAAHVFEGRKKGTPFIGFHHLRQRLDAAMREAGLTPAPWVVHDIRRSLTSGLARTNITREREVLKAVINHRERETLDIYLREGYEDAKRVVLTKWSEHILTMAAQVGSTNVVQLRPVQAS